jgi:hypothetical protein
MRSRTRIRFKPRVGSGPHSKCTAGFGLHIVVMQIRNSNIGLHIVVMQIRNSNFKIIFFSRLGGALLKLLLIYSNLVLFRIVYRVPLVLNCVQVYLQPDCFHGYPHSGLCFTEE